MQTHLTNVYVFFASNALLLASKKCLVSCTVTLTQTNFTAKHSISRVNMVFHADFTGISAHFTLKVLPSWLVILEMSLSTELRHPYQTLLQLHTNNVTVSLSGLKHSISQMRCLKGENTVLCMSKLNSLLILSLQHFWHITSTEICLESRNYRH